MFDSVSLPSGYKQIEYIATSLSDAFGSFRYIDSGIWIDGGNYNKLRVVADLMFTASEHYGGNGIVEDGTSGKRCIYFGIHYGKLAYGMGVGTTVTNINYDWKRHTWIYDTKKGIFSVDGLINTTFKVEKHMNAWGNFYVGATYEIPGVSTAAQNIYRFQIYIDDVLTRDLIPCLEESTGTIGMYDIINNGFYINKGSIPFPLPTTGISTQHKTFVDRIKYDISKGIPKVNGADYTIDKGITKIGDTGYTIPFSYRVTIHGGSSSSTDTGLVIVNGVAYSNTYGASNYKFELDLPYGSTIEIYDIAGINVNNTLITEKVDNQWSINDVPGYIFELTSDVDIYLGDYNSIESRIPTKVTTFNPATEHSTYMVTVPLMVYPDVAQSSMDGADMPIFERREWFEKGTAITFNCYKGTIFFNGVDVGTTYAHTINSNLYISSNAYDNKNLILVDDTMPMYYISVSNDIGIGLIGYDPAFTTAKTLGKYPFSLRYPEGTKIFFNTQDGTITVDGEVVSKSDTKSSDYWHTMSGCLVVSATNYTRTSEDGKWTYDCTDLDIVSVPSLTLDPIFAFNSWENIILACQSGIIPSTWAVGDSKTMTIGDTDYAITIIGKNHDTYATGGVAPLTFEMHECYNEYRSMNSTNTNVGGWRDCDMRNTHLPALKALMPEKVQSAIRKVIKSSSEGNKSKTIITTEDDLFLLAEREIFASSASWVSAKGEGTQYEYYSLGNDPVKRKSGTRQPRFTRSPYTGLETNFACVHANGFTTSAVATGIDGGNHFVGFAVAFCF